MLTKYEQKDFELIRIIAEKGRLSDARVAGRKWVEKAGANHAAVDRRNAALGTLFGYEAAPVDPAAWKAL